MKTLLRSESELERKCSSIGQSKRGLGQSSRSGDQRNSSVGQLKTLHCQESNQRNEGSNTFSWREKLSSILGVNQPRIFHLYGTDLRGNIFPQEEVVSLIARETAEIVAALGWN
jgi:hypothetical protein